ncbi:MAG: pYEATS domain-containing protein [Ferruginibacter sp.]
MMTDRVSNQKKIDKLRAKSEDSYIFACQAAVPLVLTPDLLYQLWNNFKQYQYSFEPGENYKISHIAVSDLILSDFCYEVGFELYEIEKHVRDILLSDLDLVLGEKRRNTIATFLLDYALLEFRYSHRKNLKDIHQLTAQSILNPGEMEKQIINRINSAKTDTEKVNYLLLHQSLLPVGFESDLAEISRNVNSDSLSPVLIEEENPGATGVLNVTLPVGLKSKIRIINKTKTVTETQGRAPLKVSVSNGDLFYSSYPVMVGHYMKDGIIGAEKTIDKYFGNILSRRHRLNLYPGEIGTSQVHLDFKNEFKGTVVVGLGAPGELSSFQLSQTIEHGCLQYMLELRRLSIEEKTTIPPGVTGISVLLIGSSYGGLTVETSVRSIIQGLQNAINKAEAFKPEELIIIDKVEFVELFEDKCLQCLQSLKIIEAEENTGFPIYVAEKSINKLPGSVTSMPLEDKAYWWSSIRIEMHADIGTRDKKETHVLRFSGNMGNEGVEQHQINISPEIINPLLEETSTNNNWNPALAKTIFELLIPNDLKDVIKRVSNILLILDAASATYPWELLQDTSTNAIPLSCKGGMIRQLTLDNYRIKIQTVLENKALIIGDPILSGFASQVPGAVKEANLVAELLKNAGYEMPNNCINKASTEIIKALFSYDYKIIHLSGKGVFNRDPDKPSGMVIGNNIFLTAQEISQMGTVPELVFINCCYSGSIHADIGAESANPNKLAANMGVELIRNGVKALVVAGWAIDDAAAVYFTDIFYQNLLAGLNFGESIKEARLKTFNRYPNNNTWGAYQCYGDPFYSPLNQKNKNDTEDEKYKKPFKLNYVHPLETTSNFVGQELLLDELMQWWQESVSTIHIHSYLGKKRIGKTAVVASFLTSLSEDELKGNVLVWSFSKNADIGEFLKAASLVFADEEPISFDGIVEKLELALKFENNQNLVVLDRLDVLQPIETESKKNIVAGKQDEQLFNQLEQLLQSIASGLGNTKAIITSRYQLPWLTKWEGAGYTTHDLDLIESKREQSPEASSPELVYDIYLSYAQIDNVAFPGRAQGWIGEFYDALKRSLDLRYGSRDMVKIWWTSEKIDGGVLFDKSVEEAIIKSKIMICFISPVYLASEYCQKELDFFYKKAATEKNGLLVGNRSRIVKILLNNIPYKKLPLELNATSGFPFHDAKSAEDFGDPVDTLSTEFRNKVQEVRDAVFTILNDFQKEAPLPGEVPKTLLKENQEKNKPSEKNLQIIKIFIASASELKEDTNEIMQFLSFENSRLHEEGVYLEIIKWEEGLEKTSKTMMQDEFNKALKKCDIYLSLFFTKVGKYSAEEFDMAFAYFKETGKPFMYTYFKDAPINTEQINNDINSLLQFKKKLNELGHFYTTYKNIDDLKSNFSYQLQKIIEKEKAILIPDPIANFKAAVKKLYGEKEITVAGDLQKNRWGGKAERNGRVIKASVNEKGFRNFQIKVTIESPERPRANRKQQVAFFLHDTFPNEIKYATMLNSEAEIELEAYEAFTIGAYLEYGTELELDLNMQPGYPKEFYYKDVSENFKKEVEGLYQSRKIVVKDDLQKNRWGGKNTLNEKVLSAKVSEGLSGHFKVEFSIASVNEKPFMGDVAFFLHDSFANQVVYRKSIDGMAKITVTAYEAFTVGAYITDGTILELDLQQIKGLPKKIYYSEEMIGSDGFYTEYGIRNFVKAAIKESNHDYVINSLLIFKTREQHTWLVSTPLSTYVLLDDSDTRKENNLIQTYFDKAKTLPLKFRDSGKEKRSKVVKFAAQDTWWYYSKKLFPTTESLKKGVEVLLYLPS